MRPLVGAKPASEATNRIGRGESARSTKSPQGPKTVTGSPGPQHLEHLPGEVVLRVARDVEMQVAVVAGAAGDGQLGRGVAGSERRALAGEEAQAVVARRLQVQQAHVVAERLAAP
jgi:hypothetical protein